MTIRELIYILIDAPDKDKNVEIEYDKIEVKAYNDGYRWGQLEITEANLHNNGCTLEAHIYTER